MGAAPLSHRLAAACHSYFPMAAIVSAYGMTETCSSICFNHFHPSSMDRKGPRNCPLPPDNDDGQCVGFPPPGIEVDTDTKTGASLTQSVHFSSRCAAALNLPSELAGEICVRGPNTLLRYCGMEWRPQAGGWFRTGDLGWLCTHISAVWTYKTGVHLPIDWCCAGRLDINGRLWLLGRLRDVIRSGGETVHAREVEFAIEAHPGIIQAAVVGVPHWKLGEQVCHAIPDPLVLARDRKHAGLSVKCIDYELLWQVAALICLQRDHLWMCAACGPNESGASKMQLTTDVITQHCVQLGLSRYKLPKVVIAQHAAMPTVSNGKTSKTAVKARIAAAMAAGITYWDVAPLSRL